MKTNSLGIIQHGLQKFYETIHENAGPMIILVVSSIAFRVIFPQATVPLLIIAGTFILTKAIVKITSSQRTMIVGCCDSLNKKYPYLKIVLIAFSIILLPQTFAGIAGIGIGGYLGCTRNVRKVNQNTAQSYNDPENVF